MASIGYGLGIRLPTRGSAPFNLSRFRVGSLIDTFPATLRSPYGHPALRPERSSMSHTTVIKDFDGNHQIGSSFLMEPGLILTLI